MTGHVGIIGDPVGHSLSPAFQGAAFRAAGLDLSYEAWETPAADLPARIESLRTPGVLGANVTIPHKEAVVSLLDRIDPSAQDIGAVNTIVNDAGRLTGHNTDGTGFTRALREESRFVVDGKSVLLLGAGGAARGIAFALARAGAAGISITNRTVDRAERLAAEIRDVTGVAATYAGRGPALSRYQLIVNCTSIGMIGGPDPHGVPIALDGVAPGALVVDIVYSPEDTPFLLRARDLGLPTLGGLPMLIYQGALGFELWTGRPAPIRVMFEAARAAIAARGEHS